MAVVRDASAPAVDRPGVARRRLAALPADHVFGVVLAAVAVLAQGALFLHYARARAVDGDEGVYTLTSALVMRGELLYRDFFYPQMPLLPYVYGGWMELFGETWHSARALSAVLAVAIGTLLYWALVRNAGLVAAVLAVVVYASSNLVLDWYTTVKTYPLSTFFLFAACVLLERRELVARWEWAASGLLVGFSIDSRLYFAAVLPAFALALLRAPHVREAAVRFGSGLVVGLLPSLAYLALDPGRFVWNVLGYQGIRSSGGLVGDFSQKLDIAAELVGLAAVDRSTGVQGLIVAVGAVGAAVVWRRRREPIPLSLWIAASLAAVSFLPTPTYSQYFCVVVPFAILGIAGLADDRAGATLAARVALPVAVAVFAWLGGMKANASHIYGNALRQAPEHYSAMHIDTVEDVTRFVDDHTSPGEEVITSWPGYLLGSHARPVRGFEEHFAPPTAAALSPAEIRRYRLVTASEVEDLVRRHRTGLVVYHEWLPVEPRPDWPRALRDGGYRVLATIGPTSVYGAPDRYVEPGRPLPAPDAAAVLRGPIRGASGRIGVYVRNPPTGPVLCWSMSLNGVRDAIGANLERGRRVVVQLASQGPPLPGAKCVGITPRVAVSLRRAPSEYTVSVYTRESWEGAVRGQLVRVRRPTIYVLDPGDTKYRGVALTAKVTGAAAGASGDAYADVRARVTVRLGAATPSVCWVMSGDVGGRPQASHLHHAPNGVIGPIVLRLGRRFSPNGCVRAPEPLLRALTQEPLRYYLDVHTLGSAGSRGQLSR